MKRKKILIYGVCILSVMITLGCNSNIENEQDVHKTEDVEEKLDTDQDLPGTDDEKNNDEISDDKDDNYENMGNSKREVTVYYVDDLSAVVVGKKVEIYNEFDIWNALKENDILTDECELLSFKLNDDQTIDLDFNHSTAERINSMGTTGETEIIGCIVNTYLDAYECTGIRLLEEGKDFISSHGAEFDKYPGRIEFE